MGDIAKLTAPEIRTRLAAGERVCLLGQQGTQSQILGVEDPVGGLEDFKVMFTGFMTRMDLSLDVAPDRRLDVVVYPAEGH